MGDNSVLEFFLSTCSMDPETAVTGTHGHFNHVFACSAVFFVQTPLPCHIPLPQLSFLQLAFYLC